MWQGLPLLLIPLGFSTQHYYVSMSEGNGTGFVEVPFASSDRLVDELRQIGKAVTTPTVITDSSSQSLFKLQAVYLRGRRFLIPARNYFPPKLKTESTFENREFDLKTGEGQRLTNGFEQDQSMERSVSQVQDATLLVSTGSQTALNRTRYPSDLNRVVLPVRWKDARNFLIFIHSDRGPSIMSKNRRLTTYYPPFFDGLTNSPVSPVGRYLLFRVANPTSQFRLLLNLSSMDHQLPPASVIGETREPLKFVGSGSGRVVSQPIKAQLVEGVPYICIDMGMNGVPSREVRTGLMRLWGRDLPLDYKMLVGLARNISLVTEEEYESFVAPSGIRKIPDDFVNQQFIYSGAHEDGWLSTESFFIFHSDSVLQPLVIRGVVPITQSSTFSTNMRVVVDGLEIGRKNLKIGEFEYRFPVRQRAGRRRVEIYFDHTQALLHNDQRRAAALLRCISFAVNGCETSNVADILTDTKGVWRGDNWYPLEKQNGNSFRWVNNDAEILISPQTGSSEMSLDLEPGPGLGGEPMKLEALDANGQVLLRKDVAHRQKVRFQLASQVKETGGLSTVRLHALNGGRATPGDTRILNFRVFRAALLQTAAKPVLANDVAAADDLVQLGANWYPPESLGADHFRWVDNDAVISITDPRVLAKGITIELEPGPGVKKRPMVLRVLDASGRQVQALEINGRQIVHVFPPPTTKKSVEYRLHADGGGTKIGSDPRILNFRVFQIYSSTHGANSGGDITEGAGLQVGNGWYPVETFTDGTFRWVNNDAEVKVNAAHTRLAVELQPGPGVDFKKMVIKVLDSAGHQVQAAEVNGRQTVTLLLPSPKEKDVTYRLHVDGGGKRIPTDPRTLNFRVFKLKILD